MRAFKVFVFGLFYGWLVKIAFDRIYRDNEIEDIQNENASLKEYIRSLETKLEQRSIDTKSTARTVAQPEPVQTGTRKDDLKVIKGIGPAIEKKLNNAGIHTFEALSQLSVKELENLLGNTKRLVQDEGNLIAQARRLTRRK